MWHTILLTVSIISVAVLAAIYAYFGLLWLKSWLFDEHMPDLTRSPVGRVVCIFGIADAIADPLIFCSALWAALMGATVLLTTGLWKLLILMIFVIAGLHGLRWAIRVGKVISKIKSVVHKHPEGE